MKRTVHALLFYGFSVSAYGAEISVLSLSPEQALVMVRGDLIASDADTFRTKTTSLTQAIVALSSDGGNLLSGIDIGTQIRMRNFKTWVPDDEKCASACAIAWLGGTTRLMSPTARVGFHAAYRIENGKALETGAGNALLGAYLARIGLPDRAVFYITQSAPHEMTWLSFADARAQGILVESFSLQGANEKPVPSSPPTEASREIEQQKLPHIAPQPQTSTGISSEPSFSCEKAKRPDELTICSDSKLGQADRLIARLYATANDKATARGYLRTQNIFRTDCGSDPVCILSVQISTAQILSSYGATGFGIPQWMTDYRDALLKQGRGRLWAPSLPKRLGACQQTQIIAIADRFGGEIHSNPESGSSVTFRNGGWIVSYSKEPQVLRSRIGDPVEMCLASIPKNCPPGDDRGKTYTITNYRTGDVWTLPDAQHMCGGA